jgi:hypothetical protein
MAHIMRDFFTGSLIIVAGTFLSFVAFLIFLILWVFFHILGLFVWFFFYLFLLFLVIWLVGFLFRKALAGREHEKAKK